jgi:hypothetical protein
LARKVAKTAKYAERPRKMVSAFMPCMNDMEVVKTVANTTTTPIDCDFVSWAIYRIATGDSSSAPLAATIPMVTTALTVVVDTLRLKDVFLSPDFHVLDISF